MGQRAPAPPAYGVCRMPPHARRPARPQPVCGMCSVRAISGPRPAFSRRMHRTTPAAFTPSITARVQAGCGVCFAKLTPRFRLCPPSGHIMPRSRNPPFALRPGPVKGAADVPPASSFASAWLHQVDASCHIRETRPSPFGPASLSARQPFCQVSPSCPPGFTGWRHHITSAKPVHRHPARSR